MIYGNQDQVRTLPLAVTYDDTVNTSAEISLNAATTILQVTAITSPILLSWGATDASTSNFDGVISPNQSLFFYVPLDPTTNAKFTAVNFIEAAVNGILIAIEY